MPNGSEPTVETGADNSGHNVAQVTDPVCGMVIDPDAAAVTAGDDYYFCSRHCHDSFTANPAAYAGHT